MREEYRPVSVFIYYLKNRGTPLSWKDFAEHPIIGFDEETPFLRNARKSTPAWNRDVFSIRTDSDQAQLALIRSGCGIGICVGCVRKIRDASKPDGWEHKKVCKDGPVFKGEAILWN